MERLFRRGKVPPKEDMSPNGSGYGVTIFFIEDMGLLNDIFPEIFRSIKIRETNGGMNLAKALRVGRWIETYCGKEMVSMFGQFGWIGTGVEPRKLSED